MMLKYSFNLDSVANSIEEAVKNALDKGYRTADIYEESKVKVGCMEMGEIIIGELE